MIRGIIIAALCILSAAPLAANTADDLFIAATSGDLQTVKTKIEALPGLVNTTDSVRGTPLIDAAFFGKRDVVEYLLSKGAYINAVNRFGLCALAAAAGSGSEETVNLLLDKGAKVDSCTETDLTPLFIATLKNKPNVAKLLISRGANINFRNKYGETPLHWIARSCNTEMVSLLIAKGADVNAKDNLGRTPLHTLASGLGIERFNFGTRDYAAAIRDDKAHRDTALLLISKGADIKATDRYRETPLHIAARNASKDVADVLISKGADINANDRYKHTPLMRVTPYVREMSDFLIAHGACFNLDKDSQSYPPARWLPRASQ